MIDSTLISTKSKNLAIMCAERVFWKCRRRIVCDWVHAKGKKVVRLLNGERRKHDLIRSGG